MPLSGFQLLAAIAVFANLWAFGLCAFDKRAARRGNRRVSERNLLLPVLFGGGAGLLLGMLWLRHKTNKRSFQLKLLGALGLWGMSLLWIYTAS